MYQDIIVIILIMIDTEDITTSLQEDTVAQDINKLF